MGFGDILNYFWEVTLHLPSSYLLKCLFTRPCKYELGGTPWRQMCQIELRMETGIRAELFRLGKWLYFFRVLRRICWLLRQKH